MPPVEGESTCIEVVLLPPPLFDTGLGCRFCQVPVFGVEWGAGPDGREALEAYPWLARYRRQTSGSMLAGGEPKALALVPLIALPWLSPDLSIVDTATFVREEPTGADETFCCLFPNLGLGS